MSEQTVNQTYSRMDEVQKRSRHDDLEEMKVDRMALEDQYIRDQADVQRLDAELAALTAERDGASQKRDKTKKRLHNRIRAIAELEIQEIEL